VNLYGYGEGDPVNNSDPFGLCPQWLTGIPCGLKFSGVQTNFVLGNREWSVTVGKWETASETGQFVTFGKPLGGGFPSLGSKTPASGSVQHVEGGSESLDTFAGNAMDVSVGGSYGVAAGSLSLTMIPGRGVPVGYEIGVGVSSPTAPGLTPTATRTTITGKRTRYGSTVVP
jgi:hypothetical protein